MMLDRLKAAGRAFLGKPTAGPQGGLYFLAPTKAQVPVTNSSALAFSAVYACVSLISKSIACLPIRVFEQTDRTRSLQSNHPVDRLIHRAPNPEITANIFFRSILSHVLTWGNGYAEIERTRENGPSALWLITPDRVEPKRDDNGRLYYKVRQPNGGTIDLPPQDILHFRGLGWDGIRGYSPITLAREAIATGLAADQYAGSFFGNGAVPAAVITTDGRTEISPSGVKSLLEKFRTRHGGAGNSFKVEFLDPGMDLKPVSISPADAQFLESRQFQIQDIARFYSVPLRKIAAMASATKGDSAEQGIDFLVDTLKPWGDAITAELDAKLLDGNFYTKINWKARLETDIKARAEFYREMFYTGSYSPNRILELEDENPIPDGDTHFIPANMMPLNSAVRANGSDTSRSENE